MGGQEECDGRRAGIAQTNSKPNGGFVKGFCKRVELALWQFFLLNSLKQCSEV